MMRGRRIDEIAGLDTYSLCGSRISISLSTIQEEASFDYYSSQSSFGTVSSFDSAMISAESLCSGCRFDSVVAKGTKNNNNKTSKIMSSTPAHPLQQLIRPTEIIFEGLDEMEHPTVNNLTQNARRPLRGSIGSSDSGDSGSSPSISHEYTRPLNDDGEHESYLRRTGGPSLGLDAEYNRPLNDEFDSAWEYSRPLNDDPQRYSYHHRYSVEKKGEEKVEDDRGSYNHRISDSSGDWIRQFDDMRLISSPMPSPASSCSSKSRSLAIPKAVVETILSNPALED